MHELAVTEGILAVVLRHAAAGGASRVVTVRLRIGGFSDLSEEWLARYFAWLGRGTVAEGARIEVERTPVVFRCGPCDRTFDVDLRTAGDFPCPFCGGKDVSLVSGREFFVREIEVV